MRVTNEQAKKDMYYPYEEYPTNRDIKIALYAASYHAKQCKACSCNGCENEGQGMPICEMCQRNPNRSDYYKSLPEAPK